jgi:hypothetical protein
LDNIKKKLTRFGVGGLDTLDFSKGGTKNFSLTIPVGLRLALPPISLDLLANLVNIPGIELDTDGELNVTMNLKGGFKIEGMSWKTFNGGQSSDIRAVGRSSSGTLNHDPLLDCRQDGSGQQNQHNVFTRHI